MGQCAYLGPLLLAARKYDNDPVALGRVLDGLGPDSEPIREEIRFKKPRRLAA